MTKKIIILDVEGMSGGRPYDVGYIVADWHGEIYAERSFACMPCIWENLQGAIKSAEQSVRDMTKRNIEEILKSPHKYHWSTIENIRDSLLSDITEYDIEEIWAYNCTFDKSEMIRLLGEEFFYELGIEWLDIWSAIVVTKCLTRKYVRFCQKNNFVTEKGNCKTSAEVIYSYLTNDANFSEEHTGLADAKIEYKILLTAKSTKKKLTGNISQPWKLVKKFCTERGL